MHTPTPTRPTARTLLILLAGIVALVAALSCAAPVRAPQTARLDEATLRIVTYNVNFGLAGDRETRAAIFAHDADVIVLQETTPRWEFELRADPAIAHYPHVHFMHSRGAGGQAILSRLPLVVVEALSPPDEGWFPALRAVVDFRGRDIQLLGLHLRPPFSDGGSFIAGYWNNDDVHTAEIETHRAALEPDIPTVILGDFNESADGAAIEILEAHGLTNAIPLFDPSAHTWRWDTWAGEVTHDLDHVLHGPDFRLLDARVAEIGRSDHLPIVVDLALPDAREIAD